MQCIFWALSLSILSVSMTPIDQYREMDQKCVQKANSENIFDLAGVKQQFHGFKKCFLKCTYLFPCNFSVKFAKHLPNVYNKQ